MRFRSWIEVYREVPLDADQAPARLERNGMSTDVAIGVELQYGDATSTRGEPPWALLGLRRESQHSLGAALGII